MASNVHYTIDLNKDQNNQPFFPPLGPSLHHQASSMSPSLSYFPFLINSHQDQVDLGYNSNTIHGVLDPHLEIKKFVCNGGSSSRDQIVPKKETRLKLTIRKKEDHHDQTNLLDQYPTKGKTRTNSLKWISSKVRLMKKKKLITNKQEVNNNQSSNLSNLEGDHHNHLKNITRNDKYNSIVNQNVYYESNDCVIRICSDCNTTKTPLWRSGPRGPKSLCNACGIRQRKARRAAMAMATATTISDISPPLMKKKIQNKNKSPLVPKENECKRMISLEETTASESLETTQSKSTMLSSSSCSDKLYIDDLAIILSKSSAYNQVCPQDEKEAAILLMALSYGLVHGGDYFN